MKRWFSPWSGGISPATARRWLWLIIGLYLLLASGYGIVTPLFEAPDEHHHFFTAQQMVATGRLLTVAGANDLARQEAAQPPLYYLLAALIIAPLDTADAANHLWLNPYVRLGDANAPDNINTFVHTPAEAWPWQGYVLAVHLLRVFSALFGVGTLLCLYAAARVAWPAVPENGLLATALVAFLPQFGFLHGAVTNDPLIIFLSAAGLWQLLRLWLVGVSRARLTLLGITIGLALLAKTAGLLLLLFTGAVLLLLAWRDGRFTLVVETALLVVLPALLIAGWWFWRNWLLYSDVTAANQFIALAGGDRHYTLRQVLPDLDRVWLSLFAFFGWMNVQPPAWVYAVWHSVVILAALGALWGVYPVNRERSGWQPAVLLGVWALLVSVAWLQFMLRTSADQGRLLFPALVPLALALTYGLSRFHWRWLYLVTPLLALLTSLYCLLVVIPTAYALPPTIAAAAVPATATPLHADLGQGIELVAVQVDTAANQPGGRIWVTLYWQAHAIPATPPTVVIELLGRNLALVGKLHTYHGGGRYPASLWPADGRLVVDRLSVPLDSDMAVPTQVRLYVRLLGEVASVDAGRVKVTPAAWPEATTPALAQVGDGLELVTVELETTTAEPGAAIPLRVSWRVVTAPARDLITFVHLGDPTQAPLAQADGPPLGGDYPTHLWAAGEVIADSYMLHLPPDLPDGRYPIQMGLYEPDSGVRLPLLIDGARQTNDIYPIGWLTITRDNG